MANPILRRAAGFLLLAATLSIVPSAEADDLAFPGPPYSVDQLRAWHRSLGRWPWLGPPEQEVHLRSEKECELLLAVAGNARGGTFILFASLGGKWVQVSDEIEQAHHPIHLVKTSREGWRDFETFVPLWGSGGKEVLVSTYGFIGSRYALLKSAQGMWCDQAPFRGDPKLCSPPTSPAVAPQIDLGEGSPRVEKVGDKSETLPRPGAAPAANPKVP